ncbi:hypothetical protein [Williamsia sp. D3]|uniref:hypothetical protein n=1 Tax=Williamsia sp. D3 TaxID=1313067 RepID=UPI0003D37FDF|nr:hypothetical protein [Williamsia sp. D3]ETD31522.1 hypothetical protein W823_19260 [Williamsia sp. D3]
MIDFSDYDPLVTPDDLPDGLTVEDSDLESACDDVRGACGWHIAPRKSETLVVDSDGGALLTLPSLLISEPTLITDKNDVPITDWTWSEVGQLYRACNWPSGFRAVKVTLAHGLQATPPSIIAVVADILRDRARASSGVSSIKSASLDGAAITYGDSDSAGIRRGLMGAYGHVLRRYSL